MRTKLGLIGLFLMLNAGAIAQDQCTLPPPVFCTQMNPAMGSSQGSPSCEQDIKRKYRDLLGIAETNWVNFVSSDRTLEDYGRCTEENASLADTEKKEKADERQFEFLGFRQSLFTQRTTVNRLSEPLPIEYNKIHLSQNQQNYKCFADKEQEGLTKLGKLVGRLEIRYSPPNTLVSQVRDCTSGLCKDHPINNARPRIDYAQWGTAIRITDRAIIASCHVLESLVYKDASENWHINQGEDLTVDFGERDDQFAPSYHVKDVIWIPDQDGDEGFDVALLEIEPDPNADPHAQKPTFPTDIKWGLSANDGKPREVAVIGYPDLHHPVDPCSDVAFSSYKPQGDAKFVSLGCAFAPSMFPSCVNDQKARDSKNVKKGDALFDTLFHTATTTMGESGSILVARDPQSPSVIGIHVCCSYPQDSKKYPAPPSKLRCARIKRTQTQYNQAISVCALLQNKSSDFLNALKKHNIQLPASQCPTAAPTASSSK